MGWGVWRRYDLSPAMVRAATERRLAGDWRGACAAARVEVHPSVTREAADRFADDLRHFAPDLVRWHLFDGDLRSTAVTPVVLATDGPACTLVVTAPPVIHHAARLVLAVEALPPLPGKRVSRCLWDVRHVDRFRVLVGGSARTPFFHRDGRRLREDELPGDDPPTGDRAALTEWECRLPHDLSGRDQTWRTAWRAAGVDLGPGLARILAECDVRGIRWSHLVAAARDLLGADRGTVHFGHRVEYEPYAYVRLALTLRPGRRPLLHTAEPRRVNEPPAAPELPGQALGDPWFMGPLRIGAIRPAELHPLVRTALFPDRADEPHVRPPGVRVPERVAVDCAGATHHVGFRSGRLEPLSHDPAQLRREQVLDALTAATRGAPRSCGTGRRGRAGYPTRSASSPTTSCWPRGAATRLRSPVCSTRASTRAARSGCSARRRCTPPPTSATRS